MAGGRCSKCVLCQAIFAPCHSAHTALTNWAGRRDRTERERERVASCAHADMNEQALIPATLWNGRSPFFSRWNRSHLWRFTFHFSAFYETSSRLPHASSVQWIKSRVGPKGWLKNSLGKEKLIKRWERRNSEGLEEGKAWLGRCIGVGWGGGGGSWEEGERSEEEEARRLFVCAGDSGPAAQRADAMWQSSSSVFPAPLCQSPPPPPHPPQSPPPHPLLSPPSLPSSSLLSPSPAPTSPAPIQYTPLSVCAVVLWPLTPFFLCSPPPLPPSLQFPPPLPQQTHCWRFWPL